MCLVFRTTKCIIESMVTYAPHPSNIEQLIVFEDKIVNCSHRYNSDLLLLPKSSG
jgi:hypothetical protein